MRKIRVVGAVIRRDRQVFVTQRGLGEFKDRWEFPGGKIEPGETPEQALIREIREELDAEIEIDAYLNTVEYDDPGFHLTMSLYLCHLRRPHLELLEHESAKWIEVGELETVDFLPADRIVLDALRKALLAAGSNFESP